MYPSEGGHGCAAGQEDNDLEYKSCNGAGHMCGHDSHAAMLLGAAQILKDMEDELKVRSSLCSNRARRPERAPGSWWKNGALTHPQVDAAFGLHVQSTDETGKIGYAVGVNSRIAGYIYPEDPWKGRAQLPAPALYRPADDHESGLSGGQPAGNTGGRPRSNGSPDLRRGKGRHSS